MRQGGQQLDHDSLHLGLKERVRHIRQESLEIMLNKRHDDEYSMYQQSPSLQQL
jgi:hypothetical protein